MKHELIPHYLGTVSPDSVFVEIGSDRGEGSTPFLADLAVKHQTTLHTVDIDPDREHRSYPNTVWHTAIGSLWAEHYNKQSISLLYLDNYDYIWDSDNLSDSIVQQKEWYSEQGLTMNNRSCQIEHLQQLINLFPYLDDNCLVAFDDTYLYNDCWIGKNGPGVVYLLCYGFELVYARNTFAILKRGN